MTVLDEPPGGWKGFHPPGLKVLLSAVSEIALPKHPLSRRVNQELDAMAPRIRQMMQLRGGVLVTVAVQERRPTAPNDLPSHKFNFLTIDRPGPVPALVLRTQLTSRPRRGWATKGYAQHRIYLWATVA
jgi:hypothetical protein